MGNGVGEQTIDRYLASGFATVRGMSSHFAATICAHLVQRQAALGIAGGIAEIGAFEGRFFIALALGLADGERAVAVDRFDWPDADAARRFHDNCARHGLDRARYTAIEADSRALTPEALRSAGEGARFRFVHVDGEHTDESLTRDLALAHAVLHPQGILCLDDMLHPIYPFLVETVGRYLRDHPEMRLFCIIDREDVVAAAKFLICRTEAVALYEDDLMRRFRAAHLTIGGDALGHLCVVLTPEPRLFIL
jgi:predicted O-methyltransferase YrrM